MRGSGAKHKVGLISEQISDDGVSKGKEKKYPYYKDHDFGLSRTGDFHM
jgi:hypothetical protein